MWLRRRIQCHGGIGTLWNVRAHAKLGRRFKHHLQSRRGDHSSGDNTPDPIEEIRCHSVMSLRYRTPRTISYAFCCPGWYERFNKWHSGLPSVPLEDQSRKPAVLSGTILVSSCSTLTSISSPSNPLMTT